MRAISTAMRRVRPSSHIGRERAARLGVVARLDSSERQRDRAFGRARIEGDELLDAVEAVARAVADAGIGIGGRELRMG